MRQRFESLVAGLIGALVITLVTGPFVSRPEATYTPQTAGMIAYFNMASCPAGWAEFTTGRGLYFVARPAGGTTAAVVGSALANAENRSHSHTIPALSGTAAGTGAPIPITGGAAASAWLGYFTVVGQIGMYNGTGWGYATTGSSGTPSGGYYGAADHTHAVTTVANTSGAIGTDAPYIQLLACQKS